MTPNPIYVRLTRRGRSIHLRILLPAVSLLNITQYSSKTSISTFPRHKSYGLTHQETETAPSIWVLINRRHFKTAYSKYRFRVASLSRFPCTRTVPLPSSVLFCMQSPPPRLLPFRSGVSYYNDFPSLSGILVTRR